MATPKKATLKLKEVRSNLKIGTDEKGLVHIVIDPTQTIGMSKTGKSNNVASTRGNMDLVEVDPNLAGIKAGINVYRPA